MKKEDLIFPVHGLGINVTEVLSRINSAGISFSIAENLDNIIDFIELGGPINTVSKIYRNPITGQSHVELSAAFFQFLWMMSNVAIKSIDAIILDNQLKKMTTTERTEFDKNIQTTNNPDIEAIKEILDEDSVFQRTFEEFKLALSLINHEYDKDSITAFNDLPYHTPYGLKTNNVCIHGIAFILLHEHAHYTLGHLDSGIVKSNQEIDADFEAFWNMYSDVPPEQKFTANVGILSSLFCLMMLNPTFEEDNEHPQEYKRLLDIYNHFILIFKIFLMFHTTTKEFNRL